MAKRKGTKKGKRKAGKKAAKHNPWVAHVKKYAKAHKMDYGEAMKKAKASYKG